MRSADRALAALDFLVDAAPSGVRVTDVAHHLELSLATASRLLATLVEHGYASRTAERLFTVGPRSVLLAHTWLASLRAAAAGPMYRVSSVTKETIMLGQLLGDNVVPIAWTPSPEADEVAKRASEVAERARAAGATFPLWATAIGRAMLGKLPSAQRARLVPAEPYPKLTARTINGFDDLRGLIRDGERSGLHAEHGEVHPDLWCCAVALERGSRGEVLALAAISLGEPGAIQRTRILKALRSESRQVGFSLAAG